LVGEPVEKKSAIIHREASQAHLVGSINGARLANLGPSLALSFFSHPTTLGRFSSALVLASEDLSLRMAVRLYDSRTATIRISLIE